MKKLFIIFFIFFGVLFAKTQLLKIDNNNSELILQTKQKIQDINKQLEKDIWITRYNNYLTYRKLEAELQSLKLEHKANLANIGKQYSEINYQLNNKIKIKENELELIVEFKDSPIGKLIKPIEIEKTPIISNPFAILEAFSYIKKLKDNRAGYSNILKELQVLMVVLQNKQKKVEELHSFVDDNQTMSQLNISIQEVKDFGMVVDIVSTTNEVYSKKIDQIILETEEKIASQANKTLRIILLIAVLILVAFFIKSAVKKYWSQKDRYYVTNKIINFILVFLILIVLLFSYTDNVGYLVTILGFASAGIAIALKDWFMSIFGWLVIITSGSINVGDRIRVQRDGSEVVGDVLDISLFRITIREDVTLVTYMTNRRAGRIFFIPNNYVFTEMISNYTHAGLHTVWDGIDIAVTFDSNHKKAAHLVKEIAKQYSKGYTDITRKQLSDLREKYSLKSSSVEPRVFTLIEPYGIKVSVWYLTNSYATLALRSTICSEIIETFKLHEDIKIAYPTQTLRWQNLENQAENPLGLVQTGQGLFD